MTDPAELDPTLVSMIRKLCEAGEFDAAVTVLRALKARGATGQQLLPLQAQAFACDDVPLERKREALRGVRVAMLDAMARMGALVACAAIYKLLAAVFADDRIWRRKLRRIELVLTPLPDAERDPEQAAVLEMVLDNRTHEALAALRTVARKHPEDARLQQRAEELHNLLYEPSQTRPYRVMSPEEADRLSSPSFPPPEPEGASMVPEAPIAQPVAAPTPAEDPPAAIDPSPVRAAMVSALLAGELSRAEPAARTLARIVKDERSAAAAEAVERLAAIQRAETSSNATDEITMRLSPEATVDLWIRQGMLARARDQARELLGRPENKDSLKGLTQRQTDLDRVLAFVPVPTLDAAPEPASDAGVALYDTEALAETLPMPPGRVASSSISATEEVPRVDITARFHEPPLAAAGSFDDRRTTEFTALQSAPEPPPEPPPAAPPAASPAAPEAPQADVKTRKRKVVRLG